MKNQKYIFYCGKQKTLNPFNATLDDDYTLVVWTPKIYQITPKGLFSRAFLGWGIFHYLRIFYRQDYKVFLIYYKNKEIANYSVVLPKYYKTPFMEKNDLQIGPVGTLENHQRKGLASYAIRKIVEFYKDQDIKFWYVARKENEPSLRLIERIGFTMCGEGAKRGFLRKFVIEKRY